MMILECTTYIEVTTPMGVGNVWLVKDYGVEIETLYTVIIRKGEFKGRIFEFPNSALTMRDNYSMGRGTWEELQDRLRRKSITHAAEHAGPRETLRASWK